MRREDVQAPPTEDVMTRSGDDMRNTVKSKPKELLHRLLALRNLVPALTIIGALLSTFVDKPFGLERDQLILALLAFLAIDALVERLDLLANIEKDVGMLKELVRHEKAIFEQFPPEFRSDLEKAREVWLTGIHPYNIVARYYSLLEKKIGQGDKLRVLLIDPDGEACMMSSMRFSGKASVDQERASVTSTLNQLCELRKVAPNNLEIRTIDYLLGYGVFLLDPGTDHGVAYVRRYTFKSQIGVGVITPKSIYRPQDGRLYNLVCAETRELWKSGTPWECQYKS
jgi:hypothetical protein